MKLNRKALALMAALAAGVAAAEGTVSGTTITNTATATYADPSAPASTLTSTSNTVNTVVLPKPDFDIIFQNDTPTDGGTQNVITTTTKVLTGSAGSTFSTPYTVLNNGNVALTVNLTPNLTGSSSAVGDVKYYLASDTTFSNPISTVTVPVDDLSTPADEGLVQIVQVVTVPTGSVTSNVYGASPQGAVVGTGTTVTTGGTTTTVSGNGYTSGTTYYENSATTATHTDYQFTAVKLYSLDANPNPPTTPSTPVTPSGTPYTPPAVGNVDVPTLPADDNNPSTPASDSTINTPPTQTVTGYPSTDTTPVPIVPNVSGDTQIAYPKADTDTNPDVVTFVNTLTNNGSAPDKVQLFPVGAVNPDGTLATGWSYDPVTATFTFDNGTPADTSDDLKVQFLNPDGSVIPKAADSLYPAFSVAPGATAYYQTKVTYPDANDSAPINPITVTVGVDSLNDADVSPNATTSDVIYPAAAQFGDTTVTQGANAPAAPVQTVTPYGNYGGAASPDATDGTAVFPMDVVNNGQYSDSYILPATTTLTSVGGTNPNVSTGIKYYYLNSSGTYTELDKNSSGQYVTPVVAPGTELKIFAVVDVPVGTPVGDYTVAQSATGNYSTIPMTDNNDIIRVAKPGSVAVAKFVAQTGAPSETVNGIVGGAGYASAPANSASTVLPGSDISYKIVAKNNYPTGVTNFLLSDNVPLNTTFKSATVSATPSISTLKVMYNIGTVATPSWTATAPTDLTTVKGVAVDINGDGLLNASDVLPAGTELTLNMVVTVK